jgi:hypothetical protein
MKISLFLGTTSLIVAFAAAANMLAMGLKIPEPIGITKKSVFLQAFAAQK